MAELIYGTTDTGKLRDNNEDTFIAKEAGENLYLGAAIDGVGGYSGGELAAAIARDTIESVTSWTSGQIIEILRNSILSANKKIFTERSNIKEHEKMACVLSVVLADIENKKFYFGHVGDTRIYLFRDGSLVKVSRDHSIVGFMEESGRLSELEAMSHPKRNEINKALGFEIESTSQDNFIDTGESPFLPGDQLLLCTDGLSDMITSSRMAEILSQEISLEHKATQLIDAANEAGGKDNITVVLIKNNRPPAEQVAIKPTKTLTTILPKQDVPLNKLADLSHTAHPEINTDTPRRKSIVLPLIILFLITGTLIFFFLHRPQKQNSSKTANGGLPLKTNDYFKDSSNIIIIPAQPGNLMLRKDSIKISKDSIHLMGNGIVMIADSMYHGPAVILDTSCKYLLLDSITLRGFDIGVLVKQKGLHLHNVNFEGCKIPIKYQNIEFKDTMKHNSDTARIQKLIKARS